MSENPVSKNSTQPSSNQQETLNSKQEETLKSKQEGLVVEEKEKTPGVLSMIQSVLAAMFGVQSEEKRQQDFENGHAGNYIFIGIVMVLIFIFTLIKVVDMILENAQLNNV